MTAHISAYGRLGAEPAQRQSQAGKLWVTASLAVALADDTDAPPQWFQLVAFGRVAETLARHAKGDLVSVSGRLQLNRWQDSDGKDHERLQIVADTMMSAKSVRPAGGRRSAGEADPC